jgi:DNA-binding beta-propeller fold protein YncE
MTRRARTWSIVVAIAALAIVTARADVPLVLVGTMPLPNVEGRIDHLAVDVPAQRLYVAALGNNTVEVLDLAAGRHVASVSGFKEPQGIGVVTQPPAVIVANGQGTGAEFRAPGDLHIVRSVPLGDDADNVRVDAAAKRVYVGYGAGAIAAVDAVSGRRLAEVPVGGHPESFQLEASSPRLFVNVPTARHISVIDRMQMKVVGTWPVTQAAANYPMALDEAGHRVFIGCRKPALVLIYDTRTGKQTGSAAIAGDTDDLFWDARRRRLYVSAGEGFVDVLQAGESGLRRTAHIATAAGARTSLFVPSLDRLYLAVPHRGNHAAEVRTYEAHD